MKITKSILEKIIREEILRESRYMGFEEKAPPLESGFYNVGIDDDILSQIRQLATPPGNKRLENVFKAYEMVVTIKDANMRSMAHGYFLKHFGEAALKLVNYFNDSESWKSSDLIGINLSRWDLRGVNFHGADLTGAKFDGANLHGVDFLDCNLTNTSFVRADLLNSFLFLSNFTGADLTGARLLGANLRGADLTDANLEGANLKAADLSRTTTDNVNWSGSYYEDDTKFPEGFDPEGKGMEYTRLW